ncbi:MAG: M1 family metallopeptidase [Cyclobacteriaceae bacterium]|nr:M1 family metallopeptidase [Cyclobacteriaceae bacterium]MCB0499252.1 M1 family metallopeptidase [Cyclobacteriaceae bacterium]MCB9237908.1 M1 family metallopeptidase [Flammeovirgaceae bacterium]MCO5271941.1 M1 family metallopeptidase [Cyclobacteriaceae bacterium]MCW5902487.1 M1 family metallopeptidase [Cyclobacteriaceae bacterium]
MIKYLTLLFIGAGLVAHAQTTPWQGKFEQLGQILPTPNEYRTGSGSPGPEYWQQQADYVINAELNDENQSITGAETITYHNNSPDVLTYLWLQLDQNLFDKESNTGKTKNTTIQDSITTKTIAGELDLYDFDGGYKIKSVKATNGSDLHYFVNATMMRVDLPKPLKRGEAYSFHIEWSYNINDRMKVGGRSGLEYFPEDKNYVYTIAQWFPRMCVYDDYVGWQNKQFLGRSEFATVFGNYKVKITVPADHIMAATGVLQNPTGVLTAEQVARYEKAKTSFDAPVVIATQQEAVQREKGRSKEKKTWEFHAENVRDFAFATSRKFIWDAQAVKIGYRAPLAMSFYPKEGNPLWERESTKAVKNTITTYSKHTIDFPYPVAISVHAASIGMEYPMICFNFGRPNKDGTYSENTKWRMIGVIVHEVGHNFFPMIINNDERQTTWMDEGVNSFVQYLTQVENYPDMPKRRGHPEGIIPYMKGDKSTMRPLMTSGEQVVQIGDEQYNKAATALNILRETIMGPELFDHAFKEYAQRWAFKHPKPADFFRTMEDASAVDLDWFWRGWFYTTDNVDLSVDQVRWFRLREDDRQLENKPKNTKTGDLATGSNPGGGTGFANGPEPFSLIETDGRLYGEFLSRIDDKAVIDKMKGKNFYEVTLSNRGGLVMPVIIQWTYTDGTQEIERLPAEIWRTNEQKVTKVFVKDKEVSNVVIDPLKETADIDTRNNMFPKVGQPSKFDQFRKN